MTETTSIDETTGRTELGKYFGLKIVGAPMFSPYIDEVWHELESDKEAYDAFCRETWGEHVMHNAWAKGDPVYYEIPWVSEYESAYGKLSSIWFADKNGSIDQELFDHYKSTGKVERIPPRSGAFMTCDCKPGKG